MSGDDVSARNASLRTLVLHILIFFAAALAVVYPALGYPWFPDDLHLVRAYSANELSSVWSGSWDTDNIENIGYRPLTTWFNHGRAMVFGESTVGHRLLLAGIYALFLGLLGRIATRLGLSPNAAIVGGLLTICAEYNFYHTALISDGVHTLQALLFVVSAALLMEWTDRKRPAWLALSVMFAALSLLVREDSLNAFPALILLGVLKIHLSGNLREGKRGIAVYAAALVAVAGGFWLCRSIFIYDDLFSVAGIDVFAMAVMQTIRFGCDAPHGHLFVVSFVALLILAVRLPRPERLVSVTWLLIAFLACSSAFILERDNLHIFSSAFYSLFCVSVLSWYFTRSLTWKVATAATVVVILGLNIRDSRLSQQRLIGPTSIHRVSMTWEYVHGQYRHATISQVRRASADADLAVFGLNNDAGGKRLDEMWKADVDFVRP